MGERCFAADSRRLHSAPSDGSNVNLDKMKLRYNSVVEIEKSLRENKVLLAFFGQLTLNGLLERPQEKPKN